MDKRNVFRVSIGIIACAGLLVVFLGQRYNFAGVLFNVDGAVIKFLVNRTIRFFLNDLFAVLLIYSLFKKRKFVVFAIWVQVAGIVLLLIPYFILKIQYPLYNGPMINFLHRIILNPTLILLLIPAFYYQLRQDEKPSR